MTGHNNKQMAYSW